MCRRRSRTRDHSPTSRPARACSQRAFSVPSTVLGTTHQRSNPFPPRGLGPGARHVCTQFTLSAPHTRAHAPHRHGPWHSSAPHPKPSTSAPRVRRTLSPERAAVAPIRGWSSRAEPSHPRHQISKKRLQRGRAPNSVRAASGSRHSAKPWREVPYTTGLRAVGRGGTPGTPEQAPPE